MTFPAKSFILQITRTAAPKGPSPAFSPAHILKVLFILDSEETMGRISLSKRLGIGEGSVRTIIKKLVEWSLIKVDAVGGCLLTKEGQSVVAEIKQTVIATGEVDLSEMGILVPSRAIQLRGVPLNLPSPTALRDIAVKNGAEGMVVFSIKDNRVCLPLMVDDASKDYPRIVAGLRENFDLHDGDSVLIGFSKDRNLAEMGVLSASLSLMAS